MIHLGDITAIDGHAVPPVDVVTGGSPCQDLSIAGKRAGLAGERSGLFMEQIRLIKEMRDADIQRGRSGLFIRPRFMVWENVPGAFSSNGGEDFRAVLEETIRVAEPDAPDIPLPKKGKWPMADAYYGDRWSIAYRVFDAQFWGVPQRRRRITLVADFGGRSAPEILFIRRGLQGDFEPSQEARPGSAAGIGDGTYPAIARTLTARNDGSPCIDRGPEIILRSAGFRCNAGAKAREIGYEAEKAPTLTAGHREAVFCIQGNAIDRDAKMNGLGISEGAMFTLNTVDRHGVACFSKGTRPHSKDEAQKWKRSECANTPNAFDTGEERASELIVMAHGQANAEISRDLCPTLNCNHEQPILIESNQEHATIRTDGISTTLPAAMGMGGGYIPMIAHALKEKANCDFRKDSGTYIVTAVDCRNGSEDPDTNGALQARYGRSLNANAVIRQQDQVRRLTPLECERLQGFPDYWTDIGDYTDTTGKKRKTADAPRYKAIGNSIALPPWRWVLKRIAAQYERSATLASLFDGIGGFPLIWEQLNGPGTAIWASEIDEFPIAVTKAHFPEPETEGGHAEN